MAVQGKFLSLTGSTRNYATNTLKSSDDGINFINDNFGRVKLVAPKKEEALVNTAEDGHLAVIS